MDFQGQKFGIAKFKYFLGLEIGPLKFKGFQDAYEPCSFQKISKIARLRLASTELRFLVASSVSCRTFCFNFPIQMTKQCETLDARGLKSIVITKERFGTCSRSR